MTRNPIGNILIAFCIFVVPLLFATERLQHPAPWLGFLAGCVILLTQPPVGPRRMVTDSRDRLSALGIFVGVIGCNLISVLEFGFRDAMRPQPLSIQAAAGAVMIVAGLVLRVWSIRTLGRFFTATVTVQEGQTVVKNGPYRVLRHPSYTGVLLISSGVALLCASLAGFVALLALALPAYLYRIRVEEIALTQGLGEAYRAYRTHTWRLVPFVY